MYQLLRKFLFNFDAEKVHYFSMNALSIISNIPFCKRILRNEFSISNPKPVTAFNLKFKNAVGLAAGFDKNACYLAELELLGFGFVEIGTVTPLPQEGNDKPRLFRLPKDKAIINRMGFNNDGVQVVKERLIKFAEKRKNANSSADSEKFIIGGNIGKNKITPNEDAWKDYEFCFNELFDVVDYFVVNVSSPNTPGLRDLQQKDSLRKILTHLQNLNQQKSVQRPLLLKISPDLAKEELEDIIDLALEIKLDGLVATNTTINREGLSSDKEKIENIGAGGVSGLPLNRVSGDICSYIHSKTNGLIPIISSGGIFTPADAQDRLKNGASLIQIWTSFIYEGPSVVKRIGNGLK
ncbi:MAG: quinone-dependent dihydroorotate dehydrogenase [Ginsengibacter sp.]